MERISSENAEQYTWGDRCIGWHLLRSESLSVIQERMPLGTEEARHHHAHARQFFFVLVGILTIESRSEVVTLRAGEGLHVEPGRVHEVRNNSDADVEFLVMSQPSSHGDRLGVD